MSKQGLLHNKASLRHHQAQWMLFRTFKMSWMWNSMWELWKLPRRMRRTASKQARLQKHSSHGHRVNQDCRWMYLPLVLQVHTSWWSTTHSKAMHNDYPTTSKQNTNAQLLDFDATTWVIDLPVHDLNLTFMNAPPQAKASTPQPAFQTKHTAS